MTSINKAIRVSTTISRFYFLLEISNVHFVVYSIGATVTLTMIRTLLAFIIRSQLQFNLFLRQGKGWSEANWTAISVLSFLIFPLLLCAFQFERTITLSYLSQVLFYSLHNVISLRLLFGVQKRKTSLCTKHDHHFHSRYSCPPAWSHPIINIRHFVSQTFLIGFAVP